MNLNVQNWLEFRVGDLFDIYPTKALKDVNADDCEGYGVPLVVNRSFNNGIAGKCNFLPTEKGDIITFSDTWEGETFFYQHDDFIGFAHVQGMHPKFFPVTDKILLFIATLLEFDARGRYSYGRKKRRDIIQNVMLKLPVDEHNQPDWRFMEEYIDSLHHKSLVTNVSVGQALALDFKFWKPFVFASLIDEIYKGSAINKDDLDIAQNEISYIRYITRTAENNGCELLADISSIPFDFIEKGNAITIGDTTATCFYQDEQFIVGDHIVVVRADWLNKYTGLFIVASLMKEQYRYSYGRAFIMDKIKATELLLPIKYNFDGSCFIDNSHKYSVDGYVPDWQFMEDYIKALPYGDRLNG